MNLNPLDFSPNSLHFQAKANSNGPPTFSGPQNERQRAVVDAFMHAWNSYKTYAWGHDHLKPISKGAQV